MHRKLLVLLKQMRRRYREKLLTGAPNRWGHGPATGGSCAGGRPSEWWCQETESGAACSKHHRGTTMEHYAGIDVSLESASLCVVDATGRIVREAKVASEPEVLIDWFNRL